MSTPSVYTSNNSYAIDLNRNGRHQITSLNDDDPQVKLIKGKQDDKNRQNALASAVLERAADNGAVIANATRDGGSGGTSNGSAASLATTSLASRGISLSSSGLQSVDGFTSESPNARAALDFAGAPQLPETATSTAALRSGSSTSTRALEGLHSSGTSAVTSTSAAISHSSAITVASGQTSFTRAASAITTGGGQSGQVPLQGADLLSRLSDYQSRNADGDGGLMWYALSTMAKGAGQDEKDAADLKNAMQQGKVQEKKNEIKATEEQIQKEREAAAMNLMFAIIGAVVQMALGASGNPAAAAIGNALGPLIKSMGEYINKMSGPQSEADQKKIEIMRHQMMQELYEQGIENAKSGYDEARELLKLAIKILSEHAERQTQISTTITRT